MTTPTYRDREARGRIVSALNTRGLLGATAEVAAYREEIEKATTERVLAEMERVAGEMCAPRPGGMSVNDSRPPPSFSYWVRELTGRVCGEESGT